MFYPSCAADELCAPQGRLGDIAGNVPRVMLNERLKAPYCFLPGGWHVCTTARKKELGDGADRYFTGKVWKSE